MLAIGADHGGYEMKEEIKKFLDSKGIEYTDYGTNSAQAVNYGQIAAKVGHAVADKVCDKGLLICGTGIGMSMAANKVKGIRAAVCSDYFSAKYTRLHNDANILCLGARVLGAGLALELVDVFLNTDFEDEQRHIDRISEITKIENGEM